MFKVCLLKLLFILMLFCRFYWLIKTTGFITIIFLLERICDKLCVVNFMEAFIVHRVIAIKNILKFYYIMPLVYQYQ